MAKKVEIVCKAEDLVIGIVETHGDLDAKTLRVGYEPAGDKDHYIQRNLFMDGVQLTCPHCHEPLFFRAADGEMIAAMPGTARAE